MPNLPDLYKPTSVWLADDPALSVAQARMFVWRDVLGDLLRDVTDACNHRLPDEACKSIDQTCHAILALVGTRL